MTGYNTTIEFKDTKLNCERQYEAKTMGGDYREAPPSFVDIKSVHPGERNVHEFVAVHMATIETMVLNKHERVVAL